VQALTAKRRIFYYGTDKIGGPDQALRKNPAGEPGAQVSEVFYDFETEHDPAFGEKCHLNATEVDILKFANRVFMHNKNNPMGLWHLYPNKCDFGGAWKRMLLASENEQDVF